ncbi:MAG: CHAT domain-containing protein, partial [Gammaproteobacteria bacterium]
TAQSLNNLALLYQATGAYAKAEPLLQHTLAIHEKTLGPDHPGTARSLNNLAALYQDTGAYSKAEPLYQRALAISEKALGPAHPDTATSLNNLSLLFWAQDRWSETKDNLRRVVQIDESNAQGVLALGDESRKRAYIETLTGNTHRAVTFSLAARGKVADVDSLALQVVLQRKGRVLDVLADTYSSVRRSLSAEDQQRFAQWRETIARYAALIFRGPGAMPSENYRALLDELKNTIEALEGQLSQRSTEFRTRTETVTVERVQRAIPADAVLIEWFRYDPFNPKPKGQEQEWGAVRYVAYVLKRAGQPVAVDLGEAAPIEHTLSDLLVALRDPRSSLVGVLAHELDLQLIQPLRPHLGDVRQILLSPDGMLNLLPFGALVDVGQRYLTERWQITYLTSGRDLLRLSSALPSRQTPIVIADPDFGLLDKTAAAPASENRRSTDRAAGAMKFDPLPGTAAEAQALKGILKLKDEQVLMKSQATEAALKQVTGPRILHIATHGFFLEDQRLDLESQAGHLQGQDGLQGDRGVALSGPHLPGQEGLQAPKGENPLLRSGLALAGANRLRSGEDDGVLTALEVAGLDLAGTELAVLSACETAVGAVQNGEGVYGLRRALVLAGVRTQIASLWKVDDAATKDLMIDYYRRLQAGAGRSQALREAQLTMLKNPTRAHPYYWASFIAIGEQKPLERKRAN